MASTIGTDPHADTVNEKEGRVVMDSDKEKDPASRESCMVKAGVDAMWEKKNKGVNSDVLLSLCKKSASTAPKPKRKASTNCMNYLELARKKEESVPPKWPEEGQEVLNVMQNNSSDESKRLDAAALSAVKEAAAAAGGRETVEIMEIRDFAGQDVEVKKLVDTDLKEASDKTKASSSTAVDVVLKQIKKKQKLSVLNKTKKDWGDFKDENKGMEDELDAYKKGSNQYLDNLIFPASRLIGLELPLDMIKKRGCSIMNV